MLGQAFEDTALGVEREVHALFAGFSEAAMGAACLMRSCVGRLCFYHIVKGAGLEAAGRRAI